jgi:hypothetical protein
VSEWLRSKVFRLLRVLHNLVTGVAPGGASGAFAQDAKSTLGGHAFHCCLQPVRGFVAWDAVYFESRPLPF